jgi:hypothetical protein
MTLKEIGSKTAATPNLSIKNHPSRIRQRMKLSGYENAPIKDEKPSIPLHWFSKPQQIKV